jgi:Ala-tRNA(Pro) deacylase
MPTLKFMSIFEKIKILLEEQNVEYKVIEHKKTPTSEESAKARGEPLKIGAKALLIKVKQGFMITIIPADRMLDTKALKKFIKSKSLRFASPQELKELTGLPKGAVPPFGSLIGLDMVVDKSLFEEDFMAFNAGELTRSIKMKTVDYRRIVSPIIGSFSKQK